MDAADEPHRKCMSNAVGRANHEDLITDLDAVGVAKLGGANIMNGLVEA